MKMGGRVLALAPDRAMNQCMADCAGEVYAPPVNLSSCTDLDQRQEMVCQRASVLDGSGRVRVFPVSKARRGPPWPIWRVIYVPVLGEVGCGQWANCAPTMLAPADRYEGKGAHTRI
jgi:hypothetical protein